MDLSRRLRSTALIFFIYIVLVPLSSARFHGIRHKRQNGARMYLPESFIIPGHEGDPGDWSGWSSPSKCSRSCGGGVSYQTRECLRIESKGEAICSGGNRKYFSCNTQDCPEEEPDFRSQQCSRFDKVPFDGVYYNWVPYTNAPNPCELNCVPVGERFYFLQKTKVIDGTRCNDKDLDVCVDGECQSVGCDMMLGSDAKEDKCRKCGGDGSTCKTISEALTTHNLAAEFTGSTTIESEDTSTETTTEQVEFVKSCSFAEFGCCPDGKTEAKGDNFMGCDSVVDSKDCSKSIHGCCHDGRTFATGPDGQGCASCTREPFGCCQDNQTPAHGPLGEGCCLNSAFGCCPDNINFAYGPNFEDCDCTHTPYGCCPDKKQAARGYNNEGCSCETLKFGCCPDKITPATGSKFEGCACHTMQYGCCPDGVTSAQGEQFEGCENIKELPQKACSLSKETGNCSTFDVKYYFDTEYGVCSRFWYGGCGGNDNKFETEAHCKATCQDYKGKEACLLPKNSGPCTGYNKKWYFNSDRNRCEEFNYGGCYGTSNRFDSIEECQALCTVSESIPPCMQPVDEGPCEGNIERWFYDNETDVCQPFRYGGCKGNKNNYPTEHSCHYNCRQPGVHKGEENEGFLELTTLPTTTTSKEISDISTEILETTDTAETTDSTTIESEDTSTETITEQEEFVKSCSFAEFGCCPDGKTEAKGDIFMGCDSIVDSKDCSKSIHGCCHDGRTFATGPDGQGCASCTREPFGCCQDYQTPAHGPLGEGCCLNSAFGCCPDNINFAYGPNYEDCDCTHTPYGCCPDKNQAARGYNNEGCSCETLKFGCCPDKITPATGPKFEGCACHTMQYGCCPDGTTLAQGPHHYGCHCSQSKFKCCQDEKTSAKGPDYEGCSCLESKFGCCPDGVTSAQGEKFEGCENVKEPPQKACGLPKEAGNCTSFAIKYYFDTEYGACNRFWYGGCGGNDNKFETEAHCKATCQDYKGKEACLLPKSSGSCTAYNKKWYFNSNRNRCEEFNYGGCYGTSNRFDSIEECQALCTVSESIPPCEQPVDEGPCEGNFERWFYDNETNVCQPFRYGGCKGNKNNYPTEHSCNYNCRQPGVHKDYCSLPKQTGDCSEQHARWHYSESDKKCMPFYYTGCGGNKNNFRSLESCEDHCPKEVAKDVCEIPAEVGECQNYTSMWYYDTKDERCRQFYYGGCGGNGNKFQTEAECLQRCEHKPEETPVPEPERQTPEQSVPLAPSPSTGDICAEQPDVGSCRNFTIEWYFDAEKSRCNRFYYGGCEGNENRFSTEEECAQRCSSPKTPVAPPNPPQEANICESPSDYGSCQENIIMWFFNAKEGQCQRFYYGGCDGNENRFETEQECSQRCSEPKVDIDTRFAEPSKVEAPPDNKVAPSDDKKCCADGCDFVCVRPTVPTQATIRPTIPLPAVIYPGEVQVSLEPKKPQELDVQTAAGGIAVLRCFATGIPAPPNVTWLRHNVVIDTNEGRYVLTSSGDLTIVQVRQSDTGSYVCVADNGLGAPVQREIKLQVTEPQQIPTYVFGNKNVTQIVTLNSRALVRCPAGGYPAPFVSWWHNNKRLDLISQRYKITCDYALRFHAVQLSDLGAYTCEAYNGRGRPVSMMITLKAVGPAKAVNRNDIPFLKYVIDPVTTTITPRPVYPFRPTRPYAPPPPPVVIQQPQLVSARAVLVRDPRNTYSLGSTVLLACTVRGYPVPNVVWTKDGVPLSAGERMHITADPHRLVINDVITYDTGFYGCTARNSFSSNTSEEKVAIESIIPVHPDCVDNLHFANCNLIVKGNYCTIKYYAKFCCRTCTLAGKLKRVHPIVV